MAERTGNGGHGLVKGATVFGLAVPMIVIVPLVMLMSLSTILVAMVQSQYGTNCGLSNAAGTTTSWVEWAKNIAADDSHGYSQPRRTGNPDYDCSSLVYYALKQAGLDVGSYPFSTYGEDAALKHARLVTRVRPADRRHRMEFQPHGDLHRRRQVRGRAPRREQWY